MYGVLLCGRTLTFLMMETFLREGDEETVNLIWT